MEKNEMTVLEYLVRQDARLNNIEGLLSTSKTVLNIDEVAGLTGLSKSTLYKMTCSGTIPHYKQAKHLYFDRKEVEDWLKSNRIKTNDELKNEASELLMNKKRRA